MRDSVDKSIVFYSRVSHCPAERLGHKLIVLIFIVRINSVSFINYVIDIVDIDFADDCCGDSHNHPDDGENNDEDFCDGRDDAEHSFHIAPPMQCEVSRDVFSFLLH